MLSSTVYGASTTSQVDGQDFEEFGLRWPSVGPAMAAAVRRSGLAGTSCSLEVCVGGRGGVERMGRRGPGLPHGARLHAGIGLQGPNSIQNAHTHHVEHVTGMCGGGMVQRPQAISW